MVWSPSRETGGVAHARLYPRARPGRTHCVVETPECVARGRAPARRMVLICLLALGGSTRAADPAGPLDAPQLAPVRDRLAATLDRAAASGLPVEALAGKIREGLAKRAAPEAIRIAVERLAAHLGEAQAFVAGRRRGPPSRELVRSLAAARGAGMDFGAADALVRGTAAASAVARAVDVLADLRVRGYPVDRAVALVARVLESDPAGLARVASGLETLRGSDGLTRVEALDALTRSLGGSGGVDRAVSRAVEEERRAGAGSVGASHSKSASERPSQAGSPGRGRGGPPR